MRGALLSGKRPESNTVQNLRFRLEFWVQNKVVLWSLAGKPFGRRVFWSWPALARSTQPALGMLLPRRLAHNQNSSPQIPSEFSDMLLEAYPKCGVEVGSFFRPPGSSTPSGQPAHSGPGKMTAGGLRRQDRQTRSRLPPGNSSLSWLRVFALRKITGGGRAGLDDRRALGGATNRRLDHNDRGQPFQTTLAHRSGV